MYRNPSRNPTVLCRDIFHGHAGGRRLGRFPAQFTQGLQSGSFLGVPLFLVRDSNILPQKELLWSLRVVHGMVLLGTYTGIITLDGSLKGSFEI